MKLFKLNKNRLIILILVSVLFVGFFLLSVFVPQGYLVGGTIDYLVTILLSLGLFFWGVTMIYRAQFKKQTTIIRLIVILLFVWIIMRFTKWLPNIHFVSIYFDYLYYVPTTLIPALFLFLMFESFYSDFKYKRVVYIVVLAISVSFILLAITNELHHLFYDNYQFTHPDDNPNIEKITSTYGILYYICLGYIGLLALAAIILFFAGANKTLSLKQVIIPAALMILLLAYLAMYMAKLDFIRETMILKDFAFISCLLLSGLLESLLQIGLIQNNGRYYHNFRESMLMMCIYDENNKPLYHSYTFEEGLSGDDKRYINKNIGAYKMVLVEDLSEVISLQNRIIEENKQIENTNQRLRKLIEINKEQSSVTNRLALASEMEKSISKTKEEALSLIRSLPEVIKPEKQKETHQKLGKIALLLGYMKQKCMLLLEAKQEKDISKDAFALILNIVTTDIKAVGFDNVVFNLLPFEETSFHFVSLINDFINKVAYAYSFQNIDIFIVVDPSNKKCRIRLLGDGVEKQSITLEDAPISFTESEDGLIVDMEDRYE